VSTIIAIGGDEIGVLNRDGSPKPVLTDSIHREILKRTKKKSPKVLFIPTAKDDSEEYIEAFTQYYKSLGAGKIEVLKLLYAKPSKKDIKEMILSADVIYVNGGDTFRMIKTWKRTGVGKILKKAFDQDVVLAGHSAGAICWFSYGDSDAFGKKDDFRVTALGFVDAVFCPHYDTEVFRQSGLKKVMKETPHLVSLALDECAAIEIVDNRYRILTTDHPSKARRTYWLDGQYCVEEIKPAKEFNSLDTLLMKPETAPSLIIETSGDLVSLEPENSQS
jgi:dipeptidase E